MKKIDEITKALAAPMPYRWRIQSGKANGKGQCVAYVDARDVMNRLDEVMGIDKWACAPVPGAKLYWQVSLKFGDEWITKCDAGDESKIEATKGEASDAFKRAAVKWGVGRFLYDIPMVWVDLDQDKRPVDKQGKRIWDLTKHCHNLVDPKYKYFPPPPPESVEEQEEEPAPQPKASVKEDPPPSNEKKKGAAALMEVLTSSTKEQLKALKTRVKELEYEPDTAEYNASIIRQLDKKYDGFDDITKILKDLKTSVNVATLEGAWGRHSKVINDLKGQDSPTYEDMVSAAKSCKWFLVNKGKVDINA
jgi:hypothetical protein